MNSQDVLFIQGYPLYPFNLEFNHLTVCLVYILLKLSSVRKKNLFDSKDSPKNL